MSPIPRGLHRAQSNRRRRRLCCSGFLLSGALAVVGLVASTGPGVNVAQAALPGTTAVMPNTNCTIIVPPRPLTARGLATPYQLTATNPAAGPCHEANAGQTAFVQGAIMNRSTGQISVYNPLVVDKGTRPAIAPKPPRLPRHAVVAVWFGDNGNVLTLADQHGGAVLSRAACVGGLRARKSGGAGSPFGQVGYCNAKRFFRAANHAIAAGKLRVPPLGTARDGLSCLSTRSFALVDQDQSDNVTSMYLANARGQTAQDTSGNSTALRGATVLANASDNGLLDYHVDPALGCTPWTEPDLANRGAKTPALPLDELQAAAYAGTRSTGPSALVPLNDPMTMVGGRKNGPKTNLYRAGVDQPAMPAGEFPERYCRDLEQIQGRRLQQDVNLLRGRVSPDPAAASSLFTFLAGRMQASFENLGCGSFGLTNDVSVTMNSGGVAVAACFLHHARPLTPGPGNPMARRRVCPAMTGGSTHAATPSPSRSMPAPSATAKPTTSPSTAPAPSGAPSTGNGHSPGPTSSPAPTRTPTAARTARSASPAPTPTAAG
jgi:hypothetical protein